VVDAAVEGDVDAEGQKSHRFLFVMPLVAGSSECQAARSL